MCTCWRQDTVWNNDSPDYTTSSRYQIASNNQQQPVPYLTKQASIGLYFSCAQRLGLHRATWWVSFPLMKRLAECYPDLGLGLFCKVLCSSNTNPREGKPENGPLLEGFSRIFCRFFCKDLVTWEGWLDGSTWFHENWQQNMPWDVEAGICGKKSSLCFSFELQVDLQLSSCDLHYWFVYVHRPLMSFHYLAPVC